MKTLICILAFLSPTWIRAQTFANTPQSILVTNWIQPTTDFKIVNGQVYNTRYSVKWGVLDNIVPFHNGKEDYVVGQITAEQQDGDYTICSVEALGMERTSFVKDIAIRHVPGNVTSGDPLPVWDLRAMRVESIQFGSSLLETFDCGLQVTNPIPIVQSIRQTTAQSGQH